MGTISIVNPSPGTEFSEPVEVYINIESNKFLYGATEFINETNSGSATYYEEITIGETTIYGFEIVASDTGLGTFTITFWSTDDENADVADDAEWINVTSKVAGASEVVATEFDKVYPIVTGIESKKFRVKVVVSGGTIHTVLANTLSLE